MEQRNRPKSSNMWIAFFILILIVGVAVALLLPEVSVTIQMVLLGTSLVAAGIWGRKKLRQGR